MIKVSGHVRLQNPRHFQGFFKGEPRTNIFNLFLESRTDERAIRQWCDEHVIYGFDLHLPYYVEPDNGTDAQWAKNYEVILSMDDQDAMLFKLVWLS